MENVPHRRVLRKLHDLFHLQCGELHTAATRTFVYDAGLYSDQCCDGAGRDLWRDQFGEDIVKE